MNARAIGVIICYSRWAHVYCVSCDYSKAREFVLFEYEVLVQTWIATKFLRMRDQWQRYWALTSIDDDNTCFQPPHIPHPYRLAFFLLKTMMQRWTVIRLIALLYNQRPIFHSHSPEGFAAARDSDSFCEILDWRWIEVE